MARTGGILKKEIKGRREAMFAEKTMVVYKVDDDTTKRWYDNGGTVL